MAPERKNIKFGTARPLALRSRRAIHFIGFLFAPFRSAPHGAGRQTVFVSGGSDGPQGRIFRKSGGKPSVGRKSNGIIIADRPLFCKKGLTFPKERAILILASCALNRNSSQDRKEADRMTITARTRMNHVSVNPCVWNRRPGSCLSAFGPA